MPFKQVSQDTLSLSHYDCLAGDVDTQETPENTTLMG